MQPLHDPRPCLCAFVMSCSLPVSYTCRTAWYFVMIDASVRSVTALQQHPAQDPTTSGARCPHVNAALKGDLHRHRHRCAVPLTPIHTLALPHSCPLPRPSLRLVRYNSRVLRKLSDMYALIVSMYCMHTYF